MLKKMSAGEKIAKKNLKILKNLIYFYSIFEFILFLGFGVGTFPTSYIFFPISWGFLFVDKLIVLGAEPPNFIIFFNIKFFLNFQNKISLNIWVFILHFQSKFFWNLELKNIHFNPLDESLLKIHGKMSPAGKVLGRS